MASLLRMVLAFALVCDVFPAFAMDHFANRPDFELMQYAAKEENSSYASYRVKLKVALDKPLFINFLFYRSKGVAEMQKKPLVMIFSNIAGVSMIEKWFAHYFASHGMHVALSHCSEHESITHIDETNESAIRTLLAGFALTDFSIKINDVDPKKIGLLGISFGGIRGLYQIGFDSRIKAGAFIVAGGPIQDIMAYSKQIVAKRIRDRQMHDARMSSVSEYLHFLDTHIELDLNTALAKRSSKDFYLFISASDSWVPSHYQWKIWSQLGHPRFERYPLGHLTTPLWVAMTRKREILEFFNGRWK